MAVRGLCCAVALLALVALSGITGAMETRAQGGDDLTALQTQVRQLHEQGKYAESVPLAELNVALVRQKHAVAISWQANAYKPLGRYTEAAPLLRRALAIFEKALGREHPHFAQSLNNLAGLYGAQGRYADAEPLFRRALVVREKVLGPEHPDVARALSGLAALYRAQGHYAEAEPILKRSLAIREKALGAPHRR